MKNEFKKKTDVKATGNKKIIIKQWEHEFSKLLYPGGTNPSVSKLPGATTTLKNDLNKIGHEEIIKKKGKNKNVLNYYETASTASYVYHNIKKRSALDSYETEETKKLTTVELQRLVFLEQLYYLREKRQKLSNEKEKILQETCINI